MTHLTFVVPRMAWRSLLHVRAGRCATGCPSLATTVGSGDAADRAGTEVVSESGEPLPDAAVSPPGVLLCQADEQSAELIVDGRASRRVG
jgi:hypothetical protein